MANQQPLVQHTFLPRSLRKRLLPRLIYAGIMPYGIYRVGTTHFHLAAVNALLLAAISPALGSLLDLIQKRQLSMLGLFSLAGIGIKVLTALLFHNARLVLISDSLLAGVYGLLLLGSVLIGRPVFAVVATNMYATSPEQRAQMKERLGAPGVHRLLLLLTVLWGIGLLLTVAVSVVLTITLPIAEVVLMRPVIDFGIFAVLIAATLLYRWRSSRGRTALQAAQ
jgi:hypothetical protein